MVPRTASKQFLGYRFILAPGKGLCGTGQPWARFTDFARVCVGQALRYPHSLRCRASDGKDRQPNGPEEKQPKENPSELTGKLNALLEDLQKQGMDSKKAKAVLKKWRDLGVSDPEQLRKLLLRRSLKPAATVGIQALLDGLACWGGFYTAGLIADSPPFTGQFALQLAASFFGFYYVLQALLNLSVASALLFTAYKYGTNSVELLAAVQQLAGPATGLNVLDKAQVAVNTLKVLQTLDEIAELLKNMSTTSPQRSTLQNLSAYLTLAHAKQRLGFDPARYGLSEPEAGEIAYVFSTYDVNDDYRLELSEVKKLCQDLGKELTEDELKEAMRILDTSKNGFVELDEFCAWWTKAKKEVSA
ncbi:hypothetical protein VOLCADRAFT_107336 [Volvox carteri f. nagariensis]|uniref:EF-hand domain-containing protein n=1 Tax=Volvox carteri f. nagariensis TaxID=3068 RepID=D8UDD2_VOLCA|nr:uncharacterized protein VOLCADRAFT_107336 [Volvox carteri f. nagariensis]EFJ42290.1 hypothetical protein VOLCADRAFT_107336 [Volvox carteri f. nagariensis]|eukprot:XP_002956688.1 hypothetical protein VOLCADRAFT_107336 [Volvox carteri f. nagariensis]